MKYGIKQIMPESREFVCTKGFRALLHPVICIVSSSYMHLYSAYMYSVFRRRL